MSLDVAEFEAFHHAIHGSPPFAWQSRLLRQVVEERRWPRVLDLPTGAGKTTCIDIALFALALDADQLDRWCPRRIAMVVDRRIVVDQVAERGRKLLGKLLAADTGTVVGRVAQQLRRLMKDDSQRDPLAVFTLRGGMPKDDTWARTPDQPLILASTVDQLGSRLLIQGYGVSRGMKPVHAGLVGNDLLLLLDEVHLSKPFADTLNALCQLRGRFAKTLPTRFHHALLSATPDKSDEPFRLLEEEKSKESVLGKRLHAHKPARLVDVADRRALEQTCIDEALALTKKHDVVAVVVNRVETASVVTRQLREMLGETIDVALLTGRMRPLDRDDLLHELRPRIMTGRDRASVPRQLIVVGTQCIEAGADFDFDAVV
ncbi:MAG TPA: type I-U CRISPR-associated helicase/endonuclease Cas3, partial [Polyangia bacterium]|nr:type I-U CRISPR-associated helicase/endonuclease Cas3 [Polyangia bacterium]